MNVNDVNSMQGMINQMRIMAGQSQTQSPSIANITEVGSGSSFGTAMADSLKAVNETQMTAKTMAEAYDRGADIPLADVMLSMQKSSMAYQATLQVRNKVLSAYQDIMKMPV
ncbi:MAG: flagellar hook-basal body complex protein FliE [Oceanospirillaceae bacterium]|jgi:flagellar hook-basal body complex protein FliE|nr:flagellar hook-basal body complex protein FliE [Oceanospirillaceae bacterium]MBT4441766.1 flagellar hook-basal body complex protein FliE [Oceanospirillaceae bacterium]MBT6077965.1 flagellar hook-basal body complex protein FliE [Oceanospirillaceae bacterium]MBT7331201.1 flagellar hook-basal body complex protein FliE [Oceanospirillaceae bacterium]